MDGSQWSTTSLGEHHSCGIKVGSTLWCWGSNSDGQLGAAVADGWTSSPIQVAGLNYITVASGLAHTCATRSDRTLWCWGDNAFGQLGLGDTTDRSAPTQVGVATDWTAVVAGDRHTCGLRDAGFDNTAWCWGDGTSGQLGQGSGVTSRTTPGQVGTDNDWFDISAGADHSCYVGFGDQGYCWGDNTWGQLGLGDTTRRWTPVEFSNDVSSIEAGSQFTCGIDETSGVWCWGRNDQHQVGDGTTTTRLAPVDIQPATSFDDVITGESSACARTTSNALRCWGANTAGQNGNGSLSASVSTPTQVLTSVQGGTGVGTATGGDHLCVIMGGSLLLQCWGAQLHGETARSLRSTTAVTLAGGAVWRT